MVGHLNCRHLTSLDLSVAQGLIGKPKIYKDPQLEVLLERGLDHERKYIEHLKSSGLEVERIEGVDISKAAVDQTLDAMKSGRQIIAQGALAHQIWCGRADILKRVETKSALGDWSYEVIDTKLSRETKGATILQLSLYSDLLAKVQGAAPEFMHVVVPWSKYDAQSFRVHDYAAYYRRVKSSLEQMSIAASPVVTYPDPKEHCDVCKWRVDCDKRRRDDDHLSLVAGISKIQTNELKRRSTGTATLLAAMPLPIKWKPDRGSAKTYERIREQARVQVVSRKQSKLLFEVLPIEAGFGFNCLPEPSEGDVYLDFEGDPFVGESGLEYLLGYQYKGDDGRFVYVPGWALNRIDEKRIFEDFIDFIVARLKQYPDMHIYHYAPYEPSAIKRLMGRYATREEEVDAMLRARLFVDLMAIVKHSIRASVESYSLKKLEPFYGFKRETDLTVAGASLASLQTCLELNATDSITAESRAIVESYNRDDCASTRVLRDWLEQLRSQLLVEGKSITRPEPAQGEASENITEWLQRINVLIAQLTRGVPADVEGRTAEQQALWILANILDWHRREQKSIWWEYFRLSALSGEELLDEKAAISGLTYVGEVGGTTRAPIHRYKYPSQDTDIKGDEDLRMNGGWSVGSVEGISFNERTVDIKKNGKSRDIHPEAVFTHKIVPSGELANSLARLAEYVAQNGLLGSGSYRAARALLLREMPEMGGVPLHKPGESTLDAAIRVVLGLKEGVLPIQGPPGAGKTYTAARMIGELVRKGKKVGITANSHKVIRLLMDEVINYADSNKIDVRCVQRVTKKDDGHHRLKCVYDNNALLDALSDGCQIAGGTAWLWSRAEAFEKVDVLFVDEAAQMSLANVLAVSQAAKTIVMLGDPQQLDQPVQGSHPEGTDVSALTHILHGEQTIRPDKGLFLEKTWRLHPSICSFTSEIFYENKLSSKQGRDIQVVKSSSRINGSGLRYIPVLHAGNQSSSPEEAAVIRELVEEILDNKSTWVDHDGKERPITLNDVLIITPYNAQVIEIQQRLPGARVGTVDKFQGQQAAIAIYSLATSSHADAPRGMEFLYSLNRLNVATSRAKCISILVGSPEVFEAECKTPHQMKLANAFCRFLEMTTNGSH